MTNTWSAKTALTDQEKDCLSKIQTLFQKKRPDGESADDAAATLPEERVVKEEE